MLRRIGFRRLLPVFQLVIYVALLVSAYRRVLWGRVDSVQSVYQPVALQEGLAWEPPPRPEPTPIKVALALNLPALVASALIVMLLGLLGTSQEFALFSIGAVNVVVLWYLVGLWIDRRVGFVAFPRRAYSRFRSAMWWALFSLSAVVILAVLGLVVFVAATGSFRGDLLLVASPYVAWSLFLQAVSVSGVRRQRAKLKEAAVGQTANAGNHSGVRRSKIVS